MTVREEAAKGVQQVASLLKRATVIYYTVRPLDRITSAGDVTQAQNNNPRRLPVPNVFRDLVPGGTVRYGGAAALSDNVNIWGAAFQMPRWRFRVYDPSATGTFLPANRRLASNNPADAGRFFPSPLAYWGEATFGDFDAAVVNATVQNAQLPVNWDFYMLYLAPMQVRQNEAHLAFGGSGYRVDQEVNTVTNTTWNRSTIPYELRLLHIPGVRAATAGNARQVDPSETANGRPTTHILGAPFDFARGQVNYDPIPIRMSFDAGNGVTAAAFLDGNYRYQVGAAVQTTQGSGRRVRHTAGGPDQHHPNYNDIGNDPPTQAALTLRDAGPRAPSDKVIARYIDPDSIDGTAIRLVNNISRTAGTGTYRRYLDAYVGDPSLGFGFLYNTYRTGAGPASWDATGDTPTPRRALISITTRYRNDRRLPLQFATERLEVDLEGVITYDGGRNRRDR